MTVRLHRGDLPASYDPGTAIAVDTETLGLNPLRDRLCVVQVSRGDGDADVVQILRDGPRPERLAAVMADTGVLKIFHFARFDLAVLQHALGTMPGPVYCTKIASKSSSGVAARRIRSAISDGTLVLTIQYLPVCAPVVLLGRAPASPLTRTISALSFIV